MTSNSLPWPTTVTTASTWQSGRIIDPASFVRDLHNVTIAQVLRDGYEPPDNIAICYNDLGWRSKDGYDLSKFRGRTIRLWFEIRNEYDGGLGIWTYVDDVKVTP